MELGGQEGRKEKRKKEENKEGTGTPADFFRHSQYPLAETVFSDSAQGPGLAQASWQFRHKFPASSVI